jgi:serine/threonine protein kinase
MKEVSLMYQLRHPNIVTVHGGCTERLAPDGFPEPYYCIVMEKLGTSLHDMLDPRHRPMDEREILQVACEVASALVYLHLQNPVIVHRNLKPANILQCEEGGYKIIDFGMAKVNF